MSHCPKYVPMYHPIPIDTHPEGHLTPGETVIVDLDRMPLVYVCERCSWGGGAMRSTEPG